MEDHGRRCGASRAFGGSSEKFHDVFCCHRHIPVNMSVGEAGAKAGDGACIITRGCDSTGPPVAHR